MENILRTPEYRPLDDRITYFCRAIGDGIDEKVLINRCRQLTAEGMDPNFRYGKCEFFAQEPILLSAAGKGYANLCGLLIQSGAARDEPLTKFKAVAKAALDGYIDVADTILNSNTFCGEQFLAKIYTNAASNGHLEFLRFVHQKYPVSSEFEKTLLGQCLFLAIDKGQVEVCSYLIAQGAELNGKMLHAAVRSANAQICAMLMDAGVLFERYTKDEDGRSPLHHAAARGHSEICRLLISRGHPLMIKDLEGQTPLHKAVKVGTPIIETLVELGHDVKAVDHRGWTPLHIAAYSGKVEAMKCLVELGADFIAEDGCTDTSHLLGVQQGAIASALVERWKLSRVGSNREDIVDKGLILSL